MAASPPVTYVNDQVQYLQNVNIYPVSSEYNMALSTGFQRNRSEVNSVWEWTWSDRIKVGDIEASRHEDCVKVWDPMYVLTVILFMWVYCVVNMSEFLTSLLPSKLDVATDKGESFSLWERRWLDYCDLSELDKKSKEQQMAIFRACLSDDTLKIVLNLDLDDTKKDNHKDVLEALRLQIRGLPTLSLKDANLI